MKIQRVNEIGSSRLHLKMSSETHAFSYRQNGTTLLIRVEILYAENNSSNFFLASKVIGYSIPTSKRRAQHICNSWKAVQSLILLTFS